VKLTTSAPQRDVLFYDGDCVFCRGSVDRLKRWVPRADVEYRSFRDPGALDSFPGLTMDRCERAMQFVRKDGRVFDGMEAIVQLLRSRAIGPLALAYYVPGIRQLADLVYWIVARNRFRIGGRVDCASGTCGLHAHDVAAAKPAKTGDVKIP
jgi:predicted DCC family thiol-disulfide oxidoreductase YuxK